MNDRCALVPRSNYGGEGGEGKETVREDDEWVNGGGLRSDNKDKSVMQ